MSYTCHKAIQDHMYADAPCSENDLRAYCKEQTDDYATCFDAALTSLIDAGIIEYNAEFKCFDFGDD